MPSLIGMKRGKAGLYVIFEPKKLLIGIKSKMSEGMVIGLLNKLHLHINAFTVAPTGVKVPVSDCDALVDAA